VAVLFSLLSIGLLTLAAWRDLVSRVIPNILPAILLLLGVLWRLQVAGVVAAGISLALAAALFFGLVSLHAAGLLGGGDVKLAAGFAAGLAPHTLPLFLMATGLAGGVLAAVHLTLRLTPRRRRGVPPASLLRRVARAERWRVARHGSLPYGIAIACGGIWVILAGSGG